MKRKRLCGEDFKVLWNNMWGVNSKSGGYQRIEEKFVGRKLQQLKDGVPVLNRNTNNYTMITLNDLIKITNTEWLEPEWGFPKGDVII